MTPSSEVCAIDWAKRYSIVMHCPLNITIRYPHGELDVGNRVRIHCSHCVPPWEVHGILGHKSVGYRTTEIYAKYAPDDLGKAEQAIDEHMEEVTKRTSRPLNPALMDELRASSVLVRKNATKRGNKKPPVNTGG